MGAEQHVLLLIGFRQGQPLHEPVHAEAIGPGRYRLLYSPGLVQGIAAGDEFRLTDDTGAFEVTRRSGNLAVQVFANEPVAPYVAELAACISRLGGSLDGKIERGLTFSIPVAIGFAAVEDFFTRWADGHEGWEWYYGNVYDPADGITPLLWWV
ncbi:MAG: DUF4265 domain-containing protein [Planctomyces sp.]|nr:DUF4265 domain-containing protein [Planctomyces sp.]